MDDFSQPKITWASVGETLYSLVPAEFYLLDTNYFFASNYAEYFVRILNSKIIIFWINTEDTQIGNGGAYRHYKYNLEKIRIPRQNELCDIITLDYQEINPILYHYYKLTEEEIEFIESQYIQ